MTSMTPNATTKMPTSHDTTPAKTIGCSSSMMPMMMSRTAYTTIQGEGEVNRFPFRRT